MMKMYVWSKQPTFLAVAQAESVADARRLLTEGDLGESGDGSCPKRDEARRWILEMQPHIWYGENAEFALTDSAQLAEADEECARYLARIKKLESALRVAINTVECASIDVRTGEELPWYVGAKLALREIVNP